jgi:hypothetical protein
MKRVLFIFAWVLASRLYAEDPKPFVDKVTTEESSPGGDILVQHYFFRDNTDQIWLVSSEDPATRHLLFTHERNAQVLFSEDEKWLAINNRCLSNESRVLLFRRKGKLDYEQVADLSEPAWRFFAKANGKSPAFDHRYVEALQWTDEEPATLLLSLSGHADSRNNTHHWLCLYDVQAKEFSTDFEGQNRRHTKIEGR